MKRAFLALFIILALGVVFWLWAHSRPSLDGVWKGTDQYGHEHYIEFHRDGGLTYWSRLREDDGFKEGAHFRGSYRWEGRQTVALRKEGLLPESLGKLTMTSENELKQDNNGETMRHGLVYQRVVGE
jgi:hypothetical protein